MPQLTPEAIYLRLGALVAEMPDLAQGPITPEVNRWLGQVTPLVELNCDTATAINLKVAAQGLQGVLREHNAQTIAVIVHEALARAELSAPAASQGAFITAGNTFDAISVIGTALSEAKADVLMVDPWADHKALTDYAILAHEGVLVRLLAQTGRGNLLKPVVEGWAKQFGDTRPLAVRLVPAKLLHDRLIAVDGKTVWTLGQYFNKLAERAHTTLVRVPQEIGAEKIAAYDAMWASATLVHGALQRPIQRQSRRARLPSHR